MSPAAPPLHTLLALAALLVPAAANNATALCSDLSPSCAAWAEEGECHGDNFDVVMRQCPASCGLCAPGCYDASTECHTWQRRRGRVG